MKARAVAAAFFALVAAAPAFARAELHIQELKWNAVKAPMPLFRASVSGDFAGEVEARFAMRADPTLYKPRLAFSRVATALGSTLVPRTDVYHVRLGEVLRALGHDPHGLQLLRSGVTVNNDGTVTLLVTEPIPGGHLVDITAGKDFAAWRNLAEGREQIPADRQKLVLAYVEVLVLDFVTANVGRRVVTLDATKSSLYLTENGTAFNERADPRGLDVILAQLKRVNHFPRRLIDRLRTFDRAEAERVMRDGPFTNWLLATRPLSEMMERRRAIVSLIDARLAERGEPGLFLVP